MCQQMRFWYLSQESICAYRVKTILCVSSKLSSVSDRSICTYKAIVLARGGSRIPGKGVSMFKGMGVCFADLSHFS